MATMLNTVSKDAIKPTSIMGLPFVDTDLQSVVIPIRNEIEARLLLREVRGF